MPRSNARGKVLDAARRCFVRQGITASGVDTIAAEAGVSKRTLYHHFPSKAALVRAYVGRRSTRWRRVLHTHLDGVDEPVERVMAFFDAYVDLPADERFRGCVLVNAAAEIPDDDTDVLAEIQRHKADVTRQLADLLAGAGYASPHRLAAQLLLLLEGAMAVGGVRRDVAPFADARRAARTLLDVARRDA
jgi:AcrR family transcriptional regulator